MAEQGGKHGPKSVDIENEIEVTRRRLEQLGVSEDELLDPSSDIDEQVAILRMLFLHSERSCLAFNPNDENYWRIIRARLQPVVLAYQAHEKFVRALDVEARSLRPDTLLELYKNRLNNSDKFRSYFFNLNEKIKKETYYEGGTERAVEEQSAPQTEAAIDVKASTDQMQGNIIKSLEKQLQELEKKFNKQEASLEAAQYQVLEYESDLKEKNALVAKLQKEVEQLKDENVHLKLASDAGRRQDRYQPDQNKESFSDSNQENTVDQDELMMRVDSLERELETTSQAAYNAFMTSSDLGIVVLFMLSSFRCKDKETLAQEMVKSITTFGLKVIVAMKSSSGFEYHFGSSVDSNLKLLLSNSFGTDPVIEEPHLMLYQNNCCILIQDAPKSDFERYQRLIDNLGTLLKGAQAQYEAIAASDIADRQKKQVDALIIRSYEVFKTFEDNLSGQKKRLSHGINGFAKDLRLALGIAPGDEKSIKLNMELKKLEDGANKLLLSSRLVDPAFVRNISKVAETIIRKQKP